MSRPSLWLLVVMVVSLVGCGRPFDVKTAPGFVELANQSTYAYRATTPEGVVVAVRVVDDEERGDLAFWTQVVTNQLRDVNGYALLSSEDVRSLDGTPGRRLELGRDEDNKPYTYWVTIFLAQDRLFMVEAGGAKELFDRARPSVDWMTKSVRVRCTRWVPFVTSRTCNRW